MAQIVAIAQLFINDISVGFRLLDVDNKMVKDVPTQSIMNVLAKKNIQIDNLELQDERIVGSNGSIDRLPKVINGLLIGKSPLIVLNKIDSIGYTVSDFKGEILKVKKAEIVLYAREHMVSNGKIQDSSARIGDIIPIRGKYRQIPYTKVTTEEWDEAFSKAQMIFDDIALRVGDILVVRNEGYLALAKLKGGLLTPYKYATINYITSRTAIVTSGKYMGVVSTITGKEVIPPKYMLIQKFDDNSNLFIVAEGVGSCSLYDYAGKRVTGSYNTLLPLYGTGYAKATRNVNSKEATFILNELGQEIGYYEDLNRDINDYAIVKFFAELDDTPDQNRLGIINSKGKLITKDKYSHILMLDKEGTVKLGKDINYDRYYTITTLQEIEKSGHIELRYNYISRFDDGVAMVTVGPKYGLMSAKGIILAEPIYDIITKIRFGEYRLVKGKVKTYFRMSINGTRN